MKKMSSWEVIVSTITLVIYSSMSTIILLSTRVRVWLLKKLLVLVLYEYEYRVQLLHLWNTFENPISEDTAYKIIMRKYEWVHL